MRVLITGAGGFVGAYLIRHLQSAYPDITIHGSFHFEEDSKRFLDIACHVIDLRDEAAVAGLIESARPDHIYHLAGQSFVPRSFEDPWETLENNIKPQLNLILSCLKLDMRPRMLVTGSAAIYGAAQQIPIAEDDPLMPSSPYSVSKVTQDMLGFQYFESHQFPVIRTRAFNHFGPGQSENFVAPAFGMQIARIEQGRQEPVLRVGNLSDRRDFTDVRDIVRAYVLLLEKGQAGQAYNVASGQAHSIQYLLDTLLSYTNVKIDVQVDQARLRPGRIPVLQGDIMRLQQATEWQPQIPFEKSLHDVLDYCREKVKSQGE